MDKIGGDLDSGTIGTKLCKPILEKFKLTDVFRYLFPRKRTVTWCRNIKAGVIGTRLDRFYISSLINDIAIGFETLPFSCSNHDCIVMTLQVMVKIVACLAENLIGNLMMSF